MRLENIVALTHATLLNDPFVSDFENIVFEASKVKRGDLYVAFSLDDIQEAITNGAYAILFDRPTQISDHEVAWLKVENLENALLRLLRFRFVEKNIIAYRCDEIVLKLSLGIETSSQVFPVFEDIKTLTKRLWEISDKSVVLFSPTLSDEALFAQIKELPSIHHHTIEVVEKTLFEVSFIFDDVYYEHILLSPFFLPFLESLLNLYKTLEIPFHLRKFEHIDHFEIVFTNKNYEMKEHGSSELVFIFEKEEDLLSKEMEFLTHHAPWAKTIYVLPHNLKVNDCKQCFYYAATDEIFDILEQNDFHFALIGGVTKEILNKPKVISRQKQLTFDL